MTQPQAPYLTRTPKVDLLKKLLGVFTEEQLTICVDVLERVRERAIERRCNQTIEIVINDKGFPRICKGSDDVIMPKPEGYVPE